MVSFNNGWDELLSDEFNKDYYLKIHDFLKTEYSNPSYPVYPPMYDIFNALKITDYRAVRVVILGQDPYHGPGQAHGLSFSVKDGVMPPPSLMNIFKEYSSDLGYGIPKSGNLTKWAENGVLLLNAVLTVRGGQAASHSNIGWQIFTDRVISLLNDRAEPVVFILWGNYAKQKKALITNSRHFVIESAHPSPLSAFHGFFGSKPFTKTNEFFAENGLPPVNWEL